MPVFIFTLNTKQLENYLGDLYRGFETKDYELIAALILARLAYLKTGEVHEIGFEVKADASRKFPVKPTQSEINEILLSCREENTNYDLFIIPEGELNADSNKNRNVGRATGNAFQIKKFDKVVSDDFTNGLAKYLSVDIPEKYQRTAATLVLVLGTISSGKVDFKKLVSIFSPNEYTFTNVMFISGNEEKFIIGQIWPNLFMEEYDFNDFFGI